MTRLTRIVIWLVAVGVTAFLAYGWATGLFRNFPITLFWAAGVLYLTYWAFVAPIDPPRTNADKWERRARERQG